MKKMWLPCIQKGYKMESALNIPIINLPFTYEEFSMESAYTEWIVFTNVKFNNTLLLDGKTYDTYEKVVLNYKLKKFYSYFYSIHCTIYFASRFDKILLLLQ